MTTVKHKTTYIGLAMATLMALAAGSANAAAIYSGSYVDMYLKSNTFPANLSEQKVYLGGGSGATATGYVGSQTGLPLVQFSSTTDVLDAAGGFASISAQDGYINNLTITAPGYWFHDIMFGIKLRPTSNNDLSITATDASGATDSFTNWTNASAWTNGNNKILLLSNSGDLMQSVTITSGSGLSSFGIAQLKQVEISGLTPVPVPPAVWLFGSGLLGLAAIVRRKA